MKKLNVNGLPRKAWLQAIPAMILVTSEIDQLTHVKFKKNYKSINFRHFEILNLYLLKIIIIKYVSQGQYYYF